MLEIRDLVKVYPGPVAALHGVRLDVPRGLFGLLGPNGSGKSTLMKILAGLLAPTSGRVVLDGVDVTDRPQLVWPRLGYLPQDFGFYPRLTGEAMLRHLLDLKGVGERSRRSRIALELLDRVNLGAAAGRRVAEYSGGMRQRLGIAQAIAGDPELLIVDEPTAGLDPEERLRFHHLLAELAETRTVLLSTHLVEDVAMLCPRFAVLRFGRLLLEGTPQQARRAIPGRLAEGLVARDALEPLRRTARVTQHLLFEGRHRVRLHVPEGPLPPEFVEVPATLEDAYMLLTLDDAARTLPASA
ncbi:MAG: ATP-binding cassette domain-containing protein [Vicinamibacteria bacterium]|jgi:ABC-type multidrug transport system ATPase subunit|nr:ATP-binding cassette domain-containing protein [Vicinamibacteria bacterium]